MITRHAKASDLEQVRTLDILSGNTVSDWMQDELNDLPDNEKDTWIDDEFLYVLDSDNVLIGYCTIGYADDVGKVIEDHELHDCDSLILSNVFVKQENRGNGLGLSMINNAIKLRKAIEPDSTAIYAGLMYEDLKDFYEKAGFMSIDAQNMYKPL